MAPMFLPYTAKLEELWGEQVLYTGGDDHLEIPHFLEWLCAKA